MAWAVMRRFCVFWNSYITVINSPGCTCSELTAGLNDQGPRLLASNSTVMLRLRSTWELAGRSTGAPGLLRSDSDRMLTPVSVQMLR